MTAPVITPHGSLKGVATCGRCGFSWVRASHEARWARTCPDCTTIARRPPKVAPAPLHDPSQPLVTYLGARATLYSAAIRHALGAIRMGKVAEAERVLSDVAI